MNNYGFYISQLCIRGYEKPEARLTFNSGLNVISGASDTGKTYIFQCINYAFGSSVQPKEIEEAQGYADLFLELTGYDEQQVITLKRSLIDKKMVKYECSLNDIHNNTPIEILDVHHKDNENNISTTLMTLSGAKYKNVIKNAQGHTESFTFRDFARISMLSESEIIGSLSPIYGDGSVFKKTRNFSAFKTIVTGRDDSEFENAKASDGAKAKAQAQLELLGDMIISIRQELVRLSLSIKENTIATNNPERDLERLKNEIASKNEVVGELEKSRRNKWNDLERVKNERKFLVELRSRFRLLKKNYESDIERLDFIEEADYYLNQLMDVECPVCHNPMEPTVSSSIDIAFKAEVEKIRLQLTDLLSTIEDTNTSIRLLDARIHSMNTEIQDIDKKLSTQLMPMIDQFKAEIDRIVNFRDASQAIQVNKSRLQELLTKQTDLEDILAAKRSTKAIDKTINSSTLETLTRIIQNILVEWKLEPKVKVEFDESTNDLIVNGKAKTSYGKGYASLINSAFVIGVLLFARDTGLPHPKIVVLDSPLTTYKGYDNPEISDEVNDSVKQSFFKYLSAFNNVQFIILDNVDPPIEIRDNITYYHFTKNPTVGRYGFIPAPR